MFLLQHRAAVTFVLPPKRGAFIFTAQHAPKVLGRRKEAMKSQENSHSLFMKRDVLIWKGIWGKCS